MLYFLYQGEFFGKSGFHSEGTVPVEKTVKFNVSKRFSLAC